MKALPVVINGLMLNHPYSGQGVYLREILRHLPEVTDISGVEVVLFEPKSDDVRWLKKLGYKIIKAKKISWLPHRLALLHFEYYVMYLLSAGRDVALFSPYPQLLRIGLPNHAYVMTLHDTFQYTRKEYKKKWSRKLYNWLVKRGYYHERTHLLTVSDTAKKDIEATLKPKNPVTTILNGVDHLQEEPLLTKEELHKKFGITKPYIFYHGGYDKRKNVPYLMDVLKGLRNTKDYQVVLGGKALFNSPLYDQVPTSEDIISTGFVTASELRSLYHYASCFVHASSAEGFNISVGEALMEGCPVALSDIPVHRELWNLEGVTFFPLGNVTSATAKMKEALEQKVPATTRKQLPTWKDAAKKIVAFLRKQTHT